MSQHGSIARGFPIGQAVDQAIDWVRRVRRVRRVRAEGASWTLLPTPSVPELYPNMSNTDDGGLVENLGPDEDALQAGELDPPDHWTSAKKWLAGQLGELTQLWQVGVRGRKVDHEAGILRWDAPGLTPADVGITGPTRSPVLERLLEVNTNSNGPAVLPQQVQETMREWHDEPPLEFYVDFEYCSDLNDDFSKLPEKGGKPIIFMIGCGHSEGKEWKFQSFTTDRLTEGEELRIIREWVRHMESVACRMGIPLGMARMVHWSPAEVTVLERGYNSARVRHGPSADWPDLNWFDFLSRVMRREPVVVRGALGFGLKAIAHALSTPKG